MKSSSIAVALTGYAATVMAAPSGQLEQRATACTSAVTLSGNAFASNTLWANTYYAAEVNAAISSMTDTSLKAKASTIAKTGTFFWMYVLLC
jgi:cellulose 1,4-beta-cellobiosidase